jgi:inhibitor of cysteine peptidase
VKHAWQAAALLALAAASAGLAACGGSAGGSGPSPSPHTYTEAQSGQTVTANVGEQIVVRLKENPSTGYQWTMKAPTGLTEVSSTFAGPSPSPSPLVGAGGTRTWVYRVDAPGTLALTGAYARSWEPKKPAGTFSLTIAAQ